MKKKKRTFKRTFKNIIKSIIVLILLIVTIKVGKISLVGYKMYESAISVISIEDKIKDIKNNVSYEKIDLVSKDYTNAVIAIEDHRFRKHSGIDYIATTRAVIRNLLLGELSEGGSTITQQLAKNMYFTREKKFERKVAELIVAFNLEKKYSKNEILELYINIAYFGNGYTGIKEASEGYLYKLPSEMTLYEATFLAGIPNAPSIYASKENIDLAKERQLQVINSMVKYNYITKEEAEEIININK